MGSGKQYLQLLRARDELTRDETSGSGAPDETLRFYLEIMIIAELFQRLKPCDTVTFVFG